MHAPCILSADFGREPYILEADDLLGACYRKAMGRSFLLTGKSFLLTVGLCCLRSIGLGLFYLLFGLFCLRWKIGLVFCTYGSHPSGN